MLFEENHYDELISKPIENNLLITSGDPVFVQTPTADCILGDKLTAFAPHTTEIPLNVGKDLEVMKQFYDVYSLLDVFGDFNMASSTYDKIVKTEIPLGMEALTVMIACLMFSTHHYASPPVGRLGKMNTRYTLMEYANSAVTFSLKNTPQKLLLRKLRN